jgi:hypothetical protein
MTVRKPALTLRVALFVILIGLVLCFAPRLTARIDQQGSRVVSTDPGIRLKGFEQHEAMKAASPFKGLKWQWIGPKNVSGRSIDVAVAAPRGKTYTIYVAAATGGLWKTENEATTWQPVFEQGPSTTIGDVAIAPSNPDIVWVGTGEANIFRSSQAGAGVYKSTDAGKTWQHMGLTDTYTIPRILIHPTTRTSSRRASGHSGPATPNAVSQDHRRRQGRQKILFVITGRHRSRHGPVRSEHAVRVDLAARAAQVERPAQLP